MSHSNAILAPAGRLKLARCVVNDHWPLRRAAERFNVSVPTAARWAKRYVEFGEAGMQDRPCRPLSCPHRSAMRTERRVVGLRTSKRWGPARIAYHLHLNISTVHRILRRYHCPPLRFTDRSTGIRIRREHAHRYEYTQPGEMIHVDVKKLGRIPDGGGHRSLGRVAGEANARARNLSEGARKNRGLLRGFTFIHHAVDDHSRYVYSEICPDETKETAAAFMRNAIAAFAAHGVKIQRVLTDNGSCYRSRLFAQTLTEAGIRHKRTRPYRPQTNGKVERFNRILLEEWAYARHYTSETERQACYLDFIEHYNRSRPHTALKGASPASRVNNLPG
ncbi:IS481 family transposase [Paenarthrobacter nitroguajacolicus]|uniref:IS481 family transposase n=1 Tax=Paenarthrobacter nitroguajacolicus TaxID=211146 RepID=A0A558GL47_PAENT|nr:IS481 family transposase [Paenarthrobacter nitroguajacolicus]TVU57617.1 IS481 family transposase [Paenarthrobacter nitroguajacolicus]